MQETATYVFGTPIGQISVTGNEEGLTALCKIDESAPLSGSHLPAWASKVRHQFTEYFEGTRKRFDLPLAPQGTPFQQRVWLGLLDIPFGKTCSYMELSRKLGDEKVIRAVGRANGQNPIAIIIPCHRVVGSDGSLTGYAGGLEMKKNLLDHEARVAGNYQMDLNF